MKQLLYIGNKLAEHGANPTGIDTLGPLLEKEGFSIIYASSYKNKILRLGHMLFAVVRYPRVQAVIIDTYSTANFWYAYAVSQLCRGLAIPYIPILHGGNLPQRWQTHPKLCHQLFHNAYSNVCPSDFLLQTFESLGVPRLINIPNTIEASRYHFKSRPNPRPRLLWVRALAHLYHPQMALEVVAELSKSYPEAELCLVGPDKENLWPQLSELAEELGVRVEYKGALSKSEWLALAFDYDFFLNTTHFDNTPVSVIEAMSLGLAIISTNVGGMPYLIEHQVNGYLVPDNDTQEMTEAITALLQNPDQFNKITSNAQQKAMIFDWQNQKNKWVALLATLPAKD